MKAENTGLLGNYGGKATLDMILMSLKESTVVIDEQKETLENEESMEVRQL